MDAPPSLLSDRAVLLIIFAVQLFFLALGPGARRCVQICRSPPPVPPVSKPRTRRTLAIWTVVVVGLLVQLIVAGNRRHIFRKDAGAMETSDAVGPMNPPGNASLVYSPPKRSNDTAAACLVVKNETLYLDEWADYYVALGFAPIFIYDTTPGAPDAALLKWYAGREDLRPYIRLAHDPRHPVQEIVYRRCLKEDAINHTFAALFDADEFLVLKRHDNVIDFLNDHCNEECGQLSVNLVLMGTSGETRYRPVPVTKRNVHSEGRIDNFIKTIVRPSYVRDPILFAHTVALWRGSWVDTSGTRRVLNAGCVGQKLGPNCWHDRFLNADRPGDVAVLYHYRVKSAGELRHKLCVRGTAETGGRADVNCGDPRKYDVGFGANEYDETAWEHMKKMVPKYERFDHSFVADSASVVVTSLYDEPPKSS